MKRALIIISVFAGAVIGFAVCGGFSFAASVFAALN